MQAALAPKPSRPEPSSPRPKAGDAARAHGARAGTPRFLQSPPAVQASVEVGPPGDAFEQEADRMAEQIVGREEGRGKREKGREGTGSIAQRRVQRKCAACASGAAPCPKCAEKARREAAGGAAHGLLPRSAGRPLDADTRAEMEAHFGHDFGGVRVHTGDDADRSARALAARAYTLDRDVVFRANAYRPHTPEGKSLLAHELTHVAQQRAAPVLRRAPEGDVRQMSVTVEWARARTDDELNQHRDTLYGHLAALAPASPEHEAALSNIRVIEAEQSGRMLDTAAAGGELGPQIPRPPGLPLEGGYMLQPIPGLPPELADQIPEGQIFTLPPSMLRPAGPGGGGSALGADLGGAVDPAVLAGVSDYLMAVGPYAPLEGMGGGAWAGLRGMNTALSTYGFAAAGDFSIGIVAIPPAQANPLAPHFNPVDLAAPLDRAGHTAAYVRQNGQITVVRGYNPQMSTPSTFLNVARNQGDIFSGKMGVAAEITPDSYLFQSTAARTIEYPVSPQAAARFAQGLPDVGPVGPGQPPLYSAPPSTYAAGSGTPVGCTGSNCGLWAANQVEPALGGRMGVAGQTPMMDIGPNGQVVPGNAAQGRIYRTLGQIAEGAPEAPMPNATGPAVVGQMSKGMKVLKWGGRVMLVVGVAATAAEIVTAPEGQRGRVAAKGVSSFLGGAAVGAAAGLACGPGAPVCSVVLGIAGGLLGGYIFGEIGEGVYDSINGGSGSSNYSIAPLPPPRTAAEQAAFNAALDERLMKGTAVCPNCHSAPNPPGGSGPFSDGGFGKGPGFSVTLSNADMQLLLKFAETQKPGP